MLRRPEGRDGGRKDRALLELQIHSQDIRKSVRYLFLSRTELLAWSGVLALYLFLVTLAAALTPGVVADLWRAREQEALLAERERLEERLASQVDTMQRLGRQADELRLVIDKVFLLYGLSSEVEGGQGGFPFLREQDPPPDGEDLLSYGRRLERLVEEQTSVTGIFLDEIHEFEAARRDLVRLTPSRSPLRRADFVLTSPFGDRRNPFTKGHDFHAGLDMAAQVGTEIHAPADGVVLFAGRYSLQRSVGWWRYGNVVLLGHGEHFVTIFGHCEEVLVRKGQQVAQGDVIAKVGSTGMSTSPHLHYEVRRRGEEGLRPVDPRIYILDHRWRDEERILVRNRSAPAATEFQPLPPLAGR